MFCWIRLHPWAKALGFCLIQQNTRARGLFLNYKLASFLVLPGTQWVLYCVWISFVGSWLLVIWVKPTYGRLNVDVTSDLSGDAASSSVQVTSQEDRANERTDR